MMLESFRDRVRTGRELSPAQTLTVVELAIAMVAVRDAAVRRASASDGYVSALEQQTSALKRQVAALKRQSSALRNLVDAVKHSARTERHMVLAYLRAYAPHIPRIDELMTTLEEFEIDDIEARESTA